MKTDDLIKAIAADAGAVERPVVRTLLMAIAVALVPVVPFFLSQIGLRQDLDTALTDSWQFPFKFLVTLGVFLPAFFLVKDLARPDANPKRLKALLWLAPAALLGGVFYELYSLPSDLWGLYAVGSNAVSCMICIPLLSMLPLIAILYALRRGAPANPTLAGAFGGLLAASIGATLYASHCVNDSPLFVGIWYPIGTAIVVVAGALIGNRALRW